MLLLLSAPLIAGTPALYWSSSEAPAGSAVGTSGLAIGDFDGDGALDLAASVLLTDGHTGLLLNLSDSGEVFYDFEFEDISVFLESLDIDDDGVDELMIRLPESDKGNGGVSVLSVVGGVLFGTVLFDLDHDIPGGTFGAAAMAVDLDADGVGEMLIGAPGSAVNTLYAYDYVPKRDLETNQFDAAWRGDAGLPGVGAGVLPLHEQGELLVAVCEHDFTADCASGGGLIRVAMSTWQDGNQLLDPAGLTSVSSEIPLHLLRLPGSQTVIWAGATEKTLISLDRLRGAHSALSAQGSGVTVTTTPGGAGVLWVQDGDTVYAIRSPASGPAADQADASFQLHGQPLGDVLTAAGDLDGDGCEDVIASGGGMELYRLTGLCDVTTDTGTPDTGTPDSGTPDSGTPDSGTPDSGQPCEGGMGWSCGGQGGVALLLVGLLALRRRSGSRR